MATARQILADLNFAAREICCIGCGCTDSSACQDDSSLAVDGRCTWVSVTDDGRGLCSRCAATPFDELIERMRLLPPAIAAVRG